MMTIQQRRRWRRRKIEILTPLSLTAKIYINFASFHLWYLSGDGDLIRKKYFLKLKIFIPWLIFFAHFLISCTPHAAFYSLTVAHWKYVGWISLPHSSFSLCFLSFSLSSHHREHFHSPSSLCVHAFCVCISWWWWWCPLYLKSNEDDVDDDNGEEKERK